VSSRLHPAVASETRYARQLADALMRAASEEAGRCGVSDACVVGALTLLLGRVAGSVARHRGLEVDQYGAFIVDPVARSVKAEFARRSPTLQ
jgi:hypothetical protein